LKQDVNPLADGNVLVHDDFGLPCPDEGSDEVAGGDGHVPPAFFPGTDASRGPGVGELLERVGSAARHGTQRVADHVRGGGKDGKFLAPDEKRVVFREGFFERSRH